MATLREPELSSRAVLDPLPVHRPPEYSGHSSCKPFGRALPARLYDLIDYVSDVPALNSRHLKVTHFLQDLQVNGVRLTGVRCQLVPFRTAAVGCE